MFSSRRPLQPSLTRHQVVALLMLVTAATISLGAQTSQVANRAGFSRAHCHQRQPHHCRHTGGWHVLTINLDARLGMWHPDRDTDPGVVVKAFSVDGAPLQIPGPVIRVREGVTIKARVRNSLSERLVLHGFYSRPAKPGGRRAVTDDRSRRIARDRIPSQDTRARTSTGVPRPLKPVRIASGRTATRGRADRRRS